MIELLLPCGFDTLEYSWVKTTIVICTPADYSVAKKLQHTSDQEHSGTKKNTRKSNHYEPTFSVWDSTVHVIYSQI
jgi:hypothetical protein